jgi:hypothetical protein
MIDLDWYSWLHAGSQCAAASCANDTMQAVVAPIMCTYLGAKAPHVDPDCAVGLHDQSVEDKKSMTPKLWL